MTDTLSPSQQQELDRLNYGMDIGNVFVVHGGSGMGKTTLLHALQKQTSGAFVSMREFVTAMHSHHPLAMEEAFEQILLPALDTHQTVIVDDLHLLYDVVCGCGFNMYPRSKFMIDGTFIAGTREFFDRVKQVFDAAKQNAPSIIFIDDSDVIFADNAQPGLYRYLLTMLDGLESASAGRVCVMMTAMDVSKLPPALIRSGRVELWLEMRLPNAPAREDILREHAAKLPPAIGTVDVEALAAATDGLTGADIKRLIEDGKILFAYDRAQNAPMRPSTEYFLQAIDTVRANKERYAQAEAQSSARTNTNPFAAFQDMMMAGMESAE